jgi:hypothetical protein
VVRAVLVPKVVGSIPTVGGHIFQARPVRIYTQSNITNITQCMVKISCQIAGSYNWGAKIYSDFFLEAPKIIFKKNFKCSPGKILISRISERLFLAF